MRWSQLVFFISSLILVLAAHAGECDLQSESFDSSTLALDAKTYKTDLQSCHVNDAKVVSLRSFELAHQPYNWVVDSESLITGLVRRSCLQECVDFDLKTLSPYVKALSQSTSAPQPLQDGGVKHSSSLQLQMFLTADLCPSEKPLVREVFERMITLETSSAVSPSAALVASLTPQFGHPAVPVALSVSGGWLEKHEADLAYLKQLEKSGRLQITWVNHTFTHPYDPDLPMAHNFVLKSGVDFSREILENEKLMIAKGLVPGVFVRLPGLVSDQSHMDQLRGWGLIPLGADAWIAKGQIPRNGSIILIHANGNEPKGIRMFDQLLSEHGWWVKIFKDLPSVLQDKPKADETNNHDEK